jgi:hypothetical protein
LKHLGVVYIDEDDFETAAQKWQNVDVLLAWDREADKIGAPQNVERLLRLLSKGKPVWYRGGMETVHTAELILGLGCAKVLVDKGFFRTERMPAHFVRRLGEACVAVVTSNEQAGAAVQAGARWAYGIDSDCERMNVISEAEPLKGCWGVALLPHAS